MNKNSISMGAELVRHHTRRLLIEAGTPERPQFFFVGGYGRVKSDGEHLYYEMGLPGSGRWIEATEEITRHLNKKSS